MSLFRISLFWTGYCLLALGILPSQVQAKQNFAFPSTGASGFGAGNAGLDDGFGVSSPSFPDTRTPGFADHSSMSPDSWSAPATNSVAPAFAAPTVPTAPVTQIIPVPVQPLQIAAPAPSQQFHQTPHASIESGNQIGSVNQGQGFVTPSTSALTPPTLVTQEPVEPQQSVLNPSLETTDENSFQPPSSLQEIDSALTKTPNIPELKSDVPSQSGKTGVSPFRMASSQRISSVQQPTTYPLHGPANSTIIETPANSFPSQRPELLKFDSQNALSNSSGVGSVTTPNIPNLKYPLHAPADSKSIETQANSFLGQRPELLKFDSQNALSNSSGAGSAKTPNVLKLKSDAPVKLGKTDPDSYRVASSQTEFSLPALTDQPHRQTLGYPLYGSSSSGSTTVSPPLQYALPPQEVASQKQLYGQLYGLEPPRVTNPPVFASPVVPQVAVPNQSTLGYPLQLGSTDHAIQSVFSGAQTPAMHWGLQNPMMANGVKFRPDLGHRSPTPTIRNPGSFDTGEKFDFEDKKKEYPPLSEILKTGRYFGSVATRFVKLHAKNNTAFTTISPTFVEGIAFDYDFEYSPFVRFGFESKFGPGIEFDYFRFNQQSNQASFTSTGDVTAQVQTLGAGATQFGTIDAGDTLSALHTVNLETFGVSFFKEVQLPISRINGRFGFQYTSIAQNLDASLTDITGEVGLFNSRSDFRGIGPKFTLEYYRPVGHTKLEFVTSISGSVSFGRQDEFVDNSLGQGFSRAGSDEFLSTIEFYSGVQFKKNIAENRSVFARLGTTYSNWFGGGTAIDPQSDFGLRGFSLAVGYNR